MVKKYKFNNVISCYPDFISGEKKESIHDQYIEESQNKELTPLVLRCPKCQSRDLWVMITNKFKDLPVYKIECGICYWEQVEPFSTIMTSADKDYPKTKKTEKVLKQKLKERR